MKNESAFPRIDAPSLFTEGGLSKREWFAGLAMQGILTTLSSDKANDVLMRGAKASNRTPQQAVAAVAVMQADALIAELERKEE